MHQFRRRELLIGIHISTLQESHTLFVRYSVYVMALGHVFHLLWGTEDIDDWIFGLMGALGVELILWEMIGNSDFVYNKIRDDDSEEYGASVKDSLKSVVNDLCFCGVGYFTGAVFLSLEMVWLSGVWIAASEVEFRYKIIFKIHNFYVFRFSACSG